MIDLLKRKNFIKYGLFLFYFVLIVSNLRAQTEGLLIYNWTDTINVEPRGSGARYNEVWGFEINNVEYAVIGSTMGAHIINVEDPENSFEQSFIPGKFSGRTVVHRDYHDYNGFLYSVCDQGSSSLQVVDISHLPDTSFVVFEDSTNLIRSHNLFIDSTSATLYTVGVRKPDGGGRVALQVWSLEDPSVPVLINDVTIIDGVTIEYVHDIYVRGDTAYMNAGNDGLFVADFSDRINPKLLGRLAVYQDAGYNHSGWLNERGDRYYMADETWGMDIKIVDVTDPSQMRVLKLIHAESDPEGSIPHNLIVKNDMLFVSYYFDGLQIFNVGDDNLPCRSYSYNTSTIPPVNRTYGGAWGVYPFLPSENILVSDMENGLFVIQLPPLEAVDSTFNDGTPICEPPTNLKETLHKEVFMSYNPNSQDYTLFSNKLEGELVIYNSQGIAVLQDNLKEQKEFVIPRHRLNKGVYFVILVKSDKKRVFKLNNF